MTLSAWYGGLKPGLLATLLSSVLVVYIFVPPQYSFKVVDFRFTVALIFFIIGGVTISLVCNALHNALRTLEQSEAKAVQHVKDIERRDQELRDAQEQLHLITDSMSALVTRCTPDLKYSWVSKPYADWLQRSRSEVVGAPIEKIIGKPAFDVLRPYYQKTLKGETVRLELEVEFQTIGRRWVNSVYTPTFAADGKPDGWVAVVIDIDAQKRSEEALRTTDRRKDTFLAVLAHELRNPLAPMRNALELLKRSEANPTINQCARGTMERQLSHMVRLVDDLLDLSRMSAGANPAGEGSEFLVRLPLMIVPESNESTTPHSPGQTPDATPLRVLVVDDNRDSAETLSMLLELMGNEISVAYDGEQALTIANEIKPDVVLLDIGLPKMNGYEVARQIRNEPWGSNPILVAITGLGANGRQRSFS